MFKSVVRNDLSLSFRNGLYMPFMYKGHQIVVHNAAWSFREKIWVDDDLVVNQLRFTMTSTHQLEIDSDELVITYGYRDSMSVLFLLAKVGDVPVHEVEHRFRKKTAPATMLLTTLGCGLVGAALGYAVGSLVKWLTGGA